MTSLRTKNLVPLVLASVLALPGLAQAQGKAASAPQGEMTVRSMFAFADQNKDGQLTRAEAQGHLPFTHKNFESIDTNKRGWISFDQFLGYTNKRVGKQADDIMHKDEHL